MERIDGLSIGLNLDSTALERGIPGLKSKLTALNSEMKANMSAFDRSDQSIAKYETRLQGLNKKIELQKRIVSESKAEYEKMVREHGKGSVEADKAAKAYNNQVASLNNLERYTKGQREELNKLVQEQRKSESSWGKMGQAMKTAGGHMKTMGDGIKGLGSSMTALGTTTVVGLGTAMGLAAASYEDSTVRMKNSLGLTTGEAKNLTEASRNIYKKGFSESTQEIDSALIQTRQNIRDLNDSDLERITNKALVLADTFEADVNEVTRAGNNVMKGFGIEADEAFDLMAAGAQRGLNFSNEMFDNLSEYAPLFGKMGYSAEEYFELLVNGAEAGVYNLDYINDVMKENQLRLKDGSKTTSDAMGKLSKSTQNVWKEFLKGDKTVKDVSNAVLGELEGMDDQVAANQIGVDLYGTKWEDLEADAMYSLGGIDGGLKDVDGTMDEMINNAEQSLSQQWKSTWREAKDALLPLGQTLLEYARDVMPAVKEGIAGVTDWLSNMDDSTKKNILKFGAFVAAAGPVLMTLGSLVSSVAGVVTIAGSLSGAIAGAGGIGAALATFATGPVGITIAALAALTAGGIALYNHLKKDAIPEVDLFGDEVSSSTEQAVGGFTKLNDEATAQLNQLAWSGDEITAGMRESLVNTFNEMGNQIVEGWREKKDESLEALREFFLEAKGISDEEQEQLLQKVEEGYQKREEKVQEGLDRIDEITRKAEEENRKITEEENKEMNEIKQSFFDQGIVALTENEKEQKVIMENMQRQSSEISARQAADTVKNSVETRDQVIADAEQQYNDSVAAFIMMRDETGVIKADEADALIEEAKRQRDESVGHAEDMHEDVVEQAKLQAEEHVEQVNWETGEVLSKWEQLQNDIALKQAEYILGAKTKWQELSNDSSAKHAEIVINAKLKWQELADGIRTKQAEIVGKTYKTWDLLSTYVPKKAGELKNQAIGKFAELALGANEKFTTLKDKGIRKFADLAIEANEKFTDLKSKGIRNFADMTLTTIGTVRGWGGWISDVFDDVVKGAKELPGKIGSGIKKMAGNVTSGIDSLKKKMIGGLEVGVNGVIKGINFVLKHVGVKDEDRLDKWVPEYAHGTEGHPGGLAIVGDGKGSNAGRELIQTPDRKMSLSPAKDTLVNLPKGTSVLSATETRKLFSNVPKYGWGIGELKEAAGVAKDWVVGKGKSLLSTGKKVAKNVKDTALDVWDYVSDPKELLKKALETIGFEMPEFPGSFAAATMPALNKMLSGATEFIKGKINSFGAFDSNAPGNVKSWISAAISRTGVPTSWLGPLTTIAMKESGGRTGPSTINKWDINWLRGIPSMGLMQTIGPTFNAFKEKGWGDIMNPTHNAAAAINYIKSRYGTVYNVPGIKALAQGRPYVGYATGARVAHKGLYQLAEEGHPEYVISTDPKRRTDSMKLLALAGKEIAGNKRPNQLFAPTPESGGFDMDKFARVVAQLLADYGLKEYKSETTIIASQPMNAVEAARAAERQSQKQARDWGFST
ncbi:phage tail tape measure protein [Terribacillus saccharophilus]|uniref:phage tail tape measure protein n=1 Tax=Terribacillus saccharophilus TaxID=361277 RepID=UPI000C9A76BE|nr:phage tail tape measure protein [Terribacillus goriensis]